MRWTAISGIRLRLLALVVGATTPIAYIGLTALSETWDASRRQLEESLQKQAELAAVAFEQWVDAQREPLVALAVDIDSMEDRNSVHYALRMTLTAHRSWLGLSIIDAQGVTQSIEPASALRPSVELTKDLLSQLSHRSWILDTDWVGGVPGGAIVIAARLEQGGAVLTQMEAAYVGKVFLRQIEPPNHAVMAVLGPERRIILYRNQSSTASPGLDLSKSLFFEALGNRRRAVVELDSPVDGLRRVYGLARAAETGAVVLIGVPSDALYEPAIWQRRRYVAVCAVALLLALAATFVIYRSIAKPARQLMKAARLFGDGDLTSRAPTHISGEIGELSETFNAMAARIQEREERLAQLNQMKSDFVSGVSHELRTPLTTIKTLTRVLRRARLSDEEKQEHLETISSECDRQINLVQNLLDLSRIESGTLGIALRPVKVAQVIQDCIEIQQYCAQVRRHQLHSSLDGETGFVLADRTELCRVLCTLVENAIKYTPEGGRIELSAVSKASEVAISVRDTGPGIAEQDLPYIFEKFYRGNQTPDSDSTEAQYLQSASGVGLGLYLARTIVEQIGGRIRVESKLGHGARFEIVLPVASAGQHGDLSADKDNVKAIVNSR